MWGGWESWMRACGKISTRQGLLVCHTQYPALGWCVVNAGLSGSHAWAATQGWESKEGEFRTHSLVGGGTHRPACTLKHSKANHGIFLDVSEHTPPPSGLCSSCSLGLTLCPRMCPHMLSLHSFSLCSNTLSPLLNSQPRNPALLSHVP